MTSLLANSVRLQAYGILSVVQKAASPASSLVFTRSTSFFNRSSSDDVWDSMTSVSNTGRKRGRAKGLMRKYDIYKNKQPNIIRAADRITQRTDTSRKQAKPAESSKTEAQRPSTKKFRFKKLMPLERGYAGRTLKGQRVGVPGNIDGYDFEEQGFQSVCIEMKFVGRMTKSQKNVKRASVLVVLGNGNGLAGFAVGKATDIRMALSIAKQKAALRLMYFEPLNGRTLWHNFHEEYHRSKVYAFRKEEGYGIRSHKVIKSICELIGIQDMAAKVEGETKNWHAITSAFFNGLNKQKTHQELADELGQNIVEYDSRWDGYPRLVASPSTGSKPTVTLRKDYGFDYENYFFGGKVYHQSQNPSGQPRTKQIRRAQYRDYKRRNQPHAKLLRACYGLESPPSRSK